MTLALQKLEELLFDDQWYQFTQFHHSVFQTACVLSTFVFHLVHKSIDIADIFQCDLKRFLIKQRPP